MPNDDLSVNIVKVAAHLPVDIKNPSLSVTAKETLPVEVLEMPEDPLAGLPKPLRSGTIHLRTGKKSAISFHVKKTHGLWAYLTPDSEESVKSDHDYHEGWYFLPSLSAGPWNDGPPPELKKTREEA